MTIRSELRLAPNLIMPGVGKCGTTTLHDILVQHPDIAGGFEKELRFLVDNDDDIEHSENIHNYGLSGWIARFPDGGRGPYRYWLDASPQYQAQAIAPKTSAGLNNNPRLIFIVRRPSRRLFSMYQFFRYHMGVLPHITSFARFVDEIRSPASSPIASRNLLVNVLADCRYDEMLELWSAVVPPGNVWVTSIEALVADRVGVLTDVAGWLGIDAGPLLAIAEIQSNPTIRVRNHVLHNIAGRLAGRLPNNGLIRKAKTFARNLLVEAVPPDEIFENAGILSELDREFAPSVARFNKISGRLQHNFKPLPQ